MSRFEFNSSEYSNSDCHYKLFFQLIRNRTFTLLHPINHKAFGGDDCADSIVRRDEAALLRDDAGRCIESVVLLIGTAIERQGTD